MSKPFKFRYASELAGAFVLIALLLVIGGIALAGRARGWFTQTDQLTLRLPEQGSMGLKPGADVVILGSTVGSVRNISITPEGQMLATITVRSDFARFVCTDSKARVRSKVIGETYVEFERGRGQPVNESTVIQVEPDLDIMQEIRAEVVPAIQELKAAAAEYRMLAADLRDPKGNLQQTVARLNGIVDSVDKGEGLVGRLMKDPELAQTASKMSQLLDQLNALMRDLNKTAATLPEIASNANEQTKKLPAMMQETQSAIADLRVILKDVSRSTAEMPETVRAIRQTSEGLPGLVLQMQETMRQIQRLVEGIQRSFLVNPYMDADAPAGRIAPDRAGR
jgi:phospholipid/cholesterol/gamma-HCH transport system substrate-binding protein